MDTSSVKVFKFRKILRNVQRIRLKIVRVVKISYFYANFFERYIKDKSISIGLSLVKNHSIPPPLVE